MVGPLPLRYAVAGIAVCLLIGAGIGTWVASFPVVPVLLVVGALVGVIGGLGLTALFFHDFAHPGRAAVRRRS